ncbi:MAG: metallophosphoesterase [Fimbriiglobus sp.]
MPPPERLLPILQRAKEAQRSTPGRIGFIVHLQDCTEVLVAGDLHGHIPNFQAIHKAAALTEHPTRHLVLQEVIHSEFKYANGGDKSHQLLDLYAALKSQFPTRVHMLPGNHELAQWKNRTIGKGDVTQNDAFRLGVTTAYGAKGHEVYAAYMELISGMPLALRTPNDVFISHSLPTPRQMPTFDVRKLEAETLPETDYEPGGLAYGIVWGRDTSHLNIDDYLRKADADFLISGHIPTEAGFAVPNHKQIIVDCAASPAAYILFPTDRRLTFAELKACIVVIG